jgi:hypothetical protein
VRCERLAWGSSGDTGCGRLAAAWNLQTKSLQLGGETLLERALRTARRRQGLSPVIVVLRSGRRDLGHSLQERECALVVRESTAADEGIASFHPLAE